MLSQDFTQRIQPVYVVVAPALPNHSNMGAMSHTSNPVNVQVHERLDFEGYIDATLHFVSFCAFDEVNPLFCSRSEIFVSSCRGRG